jgi:hypothetical protein
MHYATTSGVQPPQSTQGPNSSFHQGNIYSTHGSGGQESIVNNWMGDNMLNSFHTSAANDGGIKGGTSQQPTQRVQVIDSLHVSTS